MLRTIKSTKPKLLNYKDNTMPQYELIEVSNHDSYGNRYHINTLYTFKKLLEEL